MKSFLQTVTLNGRLQFRAALHNSQNATFTSLVINGHNVTAEHLLVANNELFINVVNNGQFGGGDMTFVIEEVNLSIDGQSFTVIPQPVESPSVSIRIGTVRVSSISFVDQDFNPIDVAFPSQVYLMMLKLDNPDGYEVDHIQLSQPEDAVWSKIDPETYVICYGNDSCKDHVNCPYEHLERPLRERGGYAYGQVDQLTFTVDGKKETLTFTEMYTFLYLTTSDTIHEISSPEDLMNVGDGYFYRLTQDIDLSGILWTPTYFNGYLDGNGYAINNMSIVELNPKIRDTVAVSYGLFSSISGTVKNLHMKNASLVLQLTEEPTQSLQFIRIGILAGESYGQMYNCSADAASFISVNATIDKYTYQVGGIVGNGNEGIDCIFEGKIDLKIPTD